MFPKAPDFMILWKIRKFCVFENYPENSVFFRFFEKFEIFEFLNIFSKNQDMLIFRKFSILVAAYSSPLRGLNWNLEFSLEGAAYFSPLRGSSWNLEFSLEGSQIMS